MAIFGAVRLTVRDRRFPRAVSHLVRCIDNEIGLSDASHLHKKTGRADA
jgi:hypothetical protein